MRASDLRDMGDIALIDHIATSRRDLFGLRMQHATGELDNTARLRSTRHELARALTTARQRGIDPDHETTTEADDG